MVLELMLAKSLGQLDAYVGFLNLGAALAAALTLLMAAARRPTHPNRLALVLTLVVLVCGLVSVVGRGDLPIGLIRTIRYGVFFIRLPGAAAFGILVGLWTYRKVVDSS